MNTTVTTTLNNFEVRKLTDRNLQEYFMIINNDNRDEVYFCFEKAVKDGWTDLVNNWESIKEVEIEYTEKENNFKTYRQVISFYSPESEDILV